MGNGEHNYQGLISSPYLDAELHGSQIFQDKMHFLSKAPYSPFLNAELLEENVKSEDFEEGYIEDFSDESSVEDEWQEELITDDITNATLQEITVEDEWETDHWEEEFAEEAETRHAEDEYEDKIENDHEWEYLNDEIEHESEGSYTDEREPIEYGGLHYENLDYEAEEDFEDEIEYEELYDDELEAEMLLDYELTVKKEPLPLPVGNPVTFAQPPAVGSYWPLITSHSKGKEVAFQYQTQPAVYAGNGGRSFLAKRANGTRYHVGIDLYANNKDKVVACEDGVIIDFYHFYRSTYALIVEHDNLVINYGEVHVDSLRANKLKVGDRVSAGQVIGFAGKMFKSSMLHFETYRKGTKKNIRWLKKDKAPYNLLNPTKYLLFLQEHGKIADGSNSALDVTGTKITTPASNSSLGNTIKKGRDVIGGVLNQGKLIGIAIAEISKGERDENKITNAVFYAKYPSRRGEKLAQSDPLTKDWLIIRKNIVRPLLIDTNNINTYSPTTTSGQTNFSSFTNKNVRIKRDSGWGGWKGNASKGISNIPSDLIKSKYDVAIAVASVPEGGAFDTVNMYDKGILSWGIKQWTIHAGSLQGLLSFIQQGLAQIGKSSLWDQLFPGISLNNSTLIYQGQTYPISNNSELMLLFRGSTDPKRVIDEKIDPWIIMFAIAGRHPLIQKFQFEYAKKELRDNLMPKNLGETLKNNRNRCNIKQSWCRELKSYGSSFKPENYGAIGKYISENMKALALFNGMATQNPMWTYIYLKRAIDVLIARNNSANTNNWTGDWQTEFSVVLENLFAKSGVATWGTEGVKNYARKHPEKKPRQSRTSKLLEAYKKYSTVLAP